MVGSCRCQYPARTWSGNPEPRLCPCCSPTEPSRGMSIKHVIMSCTILVHRLPSGKVKRIIHSKIYRAKTVVPFRLCVTQDLWHFRICVDVERHLFLYIYDPTYFPCRLACIFIFGDLLDKPCAQPPPGPRHACRPCILTRRAFNSTPRPLSSNFANSRPRAPSLSALEEDSFTHPTDQIRSTPIL